MEAAEALFDACTADAKKNNARLERDRQDWLNLLFYRGGAENQYVVYDKHTGTYVTRSNDVNNGGLPEWMPRPCTNVYAKTLDDIQAILDQSAPDFQFAPATDDDADRATAEVSESATPAILQEVHWDELRPRIHQLITKIDKVAVIGYYDNDPAHGSETIQALQCQACQEVTTPMDAEDAGGVCPSCGEPADGLVDVFHPQTGQPLGVEYPIGRLGAELIPSFEFSLPSSARVPDTRQNAWILTHSRMAKERVLALWGHVDGIRDAIDGNARQPGAAGVHRAFGDALPKLSSPNAAQTKNHGGQGQNDGPIVFRLWHDPTPELPDGLFMVKIGDLVLEAGPLPYKDHEGRPFKNVVVRSYKPAPGTSFGKPPSDDLQPLQEQRNTVECLLTTILLREAAPRTYVPLDVTLVDDITGTPGEQIRYRSLIPGSKPETERGLNPPEGLFRFLEMIDEKFEKLSGLNAVLSGARPDGDPTLGEVEILQERGMSSFKSALDALISFERQLILMLLCIARQCMWSSRFRKIRGENGQWELTKFIGADLGGRIDITCDPQSAWPKSPVMQSLRLDKAIERGVLPPPAQDPELQGKVLALYGLSELKPSMDVDRKQIARILDRWKQARTPNEIRPIDPIVDNLPLHLYLKTLFLKTEEAEKLRDGDPETGTPGNPALYQAMVMHVQQIGAMLAQQQAQTAAAQSGKPAPGEGEDRGNGEALSAAIDAGVLQPKGAQGDPMQEALNAGALIPAGAMPEPPAGPSIDDMIQAGALLPLPSQDSQAGAQAAPPR